MNAKDHEVAVLDYMARLWSSKTPFDPTQGDSYWGYVLSMGSTEGIIPPLYHLVYLYYLGNTYGLWQARDYLQGKSLRYTHTSTFVAAALSPKILGPTAIPLLLRSVKGKYPN